MKIRSDMVGSSFGNWKVLSFVCVREVGKSHVKKAFWLCECQCEKKTLREIPTDSLVSGNSKSCGCRKIELLNARSTKHGFARRGKNGSSIYHVWSSMRNRCLNPNDQQYKYYGGRGVTICDEWASSFIAFKDWAFENGYSVGLTIDRVDNNGNYEPDNCRWTDMKTQANNSRRCTYVTINDETHTVKEWSEILSIPYGTIMNRKNRYKNLSYEQAILMPTYTKFHKMEGIR